MSTATACGATVCDAMPSIRARHACVPAPFWHLGQPIEAPNFFTIASVMYILRPLATIGWLSLSSRRLAAVPRHLAIPLQLQLSQLPARSFPLLESPNTATRLKASGGEVRPDGPHVPKASRKLKNRLTPPSGAPWFATHSSQSSRCPVVQSNVLVAALSLSGPRNLDPTLVQLSELLRGKDSSPKRSFRTPRLRRRTCAAGSPREQCASARAP